MSNRASKGSAFERQICKELSKWWTKGERDDIFWRSSQSGGRAKFRGRKGKATYGQHGDITATDPIGCPLTELITIEVKRGYNKASIQDMLDKRPNAANQEWEKWFYQTYESMVMADTYTWMIISKRDRRKTLVHFPLSLLKKLGIEDCITIPSAGFHIDLNGRVLMVCTMLLKHWYEEVDPKRIRDLSRKFKNWRKKNARTKSKEE